MGNVSGEFDVFGKFSELVTEFGFAGFVFEDLGNFMGSGECLGFVLDELTGEIVLYGHTGNSVGTINTWLSSEFFGDENGFYEVFEGLLDYLLRVPRRLWVRELSTGLDWGFVEIG